MYWSSLRFGSLTVHPQVGKYVFEVQVYLGELDPEAVRAELYTEPQDGREPFRQPMNRGEKLKGPANGFVYSASVPATCPATHYTPRLVPFKAGASVPLEAQFILWRDTP